MTKDVAMTDTDMRRDLTLVFLRVCLGAIFIYHARMKLGWTEFSILWETDNLISYTYTQLGPFIQLVTQTLDFLTPSQAEFMAISAALIEYCAGWGIFLGFMTRISAALLCCLMIVAIYFHLPYGFNGAQGGFEWAMLCLAGSQALLTGAGRYSIEGLISATTTAESQA